MYVEYKSIRLFEILIVPIIYIIIYDKRIKLKGSESMRVRCCFQVQFLLKDNEKYIF